MNLIIKLNKQKLDQIALEIKDLETVKDKIKQVLEIIHREFDKQAKFIDQNPELSYSFANFYNKHQQDVTLINQEISKLSTAIQNKNDELINIFSEIKKFEIIRAKRLEQTKIEQHKQEVNHFDEIALRLRGL